MAARKAKQPLTVSVQPFALGGERGWGIKSSARKWHCYIFRDKANAEQVCASIGETQIRIEVNVGYNEPAAWAHGDK